MTLKLIDLRGPTVEIPGMRFPLLVILLLAAFSASPISAQSFAKLYSLEGSAQFRPSGADPGVKDGWTEAVIDQQLGKGTLLRTGPDSRVGIELEDGTLVRLGPNGILRVGGGDESKLSFVQGVLHFFSRRPHDEYVIETSFVSAAIRGSEVTISAQQDRTVVQVLDGSVDCRSSIDQAIVGRGEELLARPNEKFVKRIMVKPRDAVQWTVHLPQTLVQSLSTPGSKRALDALASGAGDGTDPLLAALPDTDESSAVRALSYLVRDDASRAETEVDARLQKNPTSVTLLSVKAYIQQATFNLRGALETIDSALKHEPRNTYLQARRAELLLGANDLAEASDQVGKLSGSADPYVLAVTGFVRLAQKEPISASEAFRAASRADSGWGLPHLGLGLATFYQGDVDAAVSEIERAVALEPSVSLYRSYLGKALFEKESEEKADNEFSQAITLDPNDPTPYLYRSYLRLSQRRPVEALEDIEASIDLNDNRAVFRSQLLLDQDNSVRSSSLAQAYNQLGFKEVARATALDALNRDYSNYSAHYLLADSYALETSRLGASLTEFLVARLLAPVNYNSVFPSSSTNPGSNEYTALFDRPVNRIGVSGGIGSFERQADGALVTSGSDGTFGYAASLNGETQDGYRRRDEYNESSFTWLSQWQATPDDTIIFDANVLSMHGGDTSLGYFSQENDPFFHSDNDDALARLGFRHRFEDQSTIIGQILVNDSVVNVRRQDQAREAFFNVVQNDVVLTTIPGMFTVDQSIALRSRGIRADLQYLVDSEIASVVLGGGVQRASVTNDEEGAITAPTDFATFFPKFNSEVENDAESAKLFQYTTFHLGRIADLTAGLQYAHLKTGQNPLSIEGLAVPYLDGARSEDYWNPKVGLSIYPVDGLTVRGAYFTTVSNSGVRELEVLEPTFVSGFNQAFFDVVPGTEAEAFATGFDLKLPSKTYLGSEMIFRKIIRRGPVSVDTITADQTNGTVSGSASVLLDSVAIFEDENSVRSYINQILTKRSVFSLSHSWTEGRIALNDRQELTHHVGGDLRYFHPSGWFAAFGAAYRNQDLSGFAPQLALDGSEDFWLLGTAVGYQLPKRHGSITFEVDNLLDRSFRYIPTSVEDPDSLLPGIGFFLRVNLAM